MSERELRRVLADVMDDLATGRVRLRSPLRVVRRAVAPALLAASLGMAGCEARGVGAPVDAGPDARPDVVHMADATYGAPFDAYQPPDAAPDHDADLTDADTMDAEVLDSGPIGVYLAPPPVNPE